jgi:titin
VYILGRDSLSNVVQGNLIGTDASGLLALGNSTNGITISDASYCVIGGTNATQRNIISGNGQSGVYLLGSASKQNQIIGNFIGLNRLGNNVISNLADGVTINRSRTNQVGGILLGQGNVISGNNERGIAIALNAFGNLVQGNWIGLDATGTNIFGNRYAGIGLLNCTSNLVGGSVPAARNVIAGNRQSGISLSAATNSVVVGNWIGVDITGTRALSNLFHGISIVGGVSNQVGGVFSGEGNLVSGNVQNGVYLGAGTIETRVRQNLIGTDWQGKVAISNGFCGVQVDNGQRNWIGGFKTGEGNLISGNSQNGVYLIGTNATLNRVSGNKIGTTASGLQVLGNGYSGLGVENASSNTVGGLEPGAGNLISGNYDNGIYLLSAGASNNVIAGNLLGLNLAGDGALPNQLCGLQVFGAGNNTIGGTNALARNLISGNARVGLVIRDGGANQNIVCGNFIGLKADGVGALGNGQHGIEIANLAANNVIGLPGGLGGNRIAYALTPGYDGVRVRDGCIGNRVRANSIFKNADLSIDFGNTGMNPNQPWSGSSISPNLANYPVITSASGRYRIEVRGAMTNVASQVYTLDFFAGPDPGVGGGGEARQWIGAAAVTTDGSGRADFTLLLTNLTPFTGFLSVTAIDGSGNTSEVSPSFAQGSSPLADQDGDGIPDEYELVMGWNPLSASDATQDADSDGMSNRGEFKSGTNPFDAADVFRIVNAVHTRVSSRFSYPTVLGKYYAIENAPLPAGPWTALATNIVGTGNVHDFTNQVGFASGTRIYRVKSN